VEIVVDFQLHSDALTIPETVVRADTTYMRPAEGQVVQNIPCAVEERDSWVAVLAVLAVEEKPKRILPHPHPMIASVERAFVLTYKK
jgi:hypothetical protein